MKLLKGWKIRLLAGLVMATAGGQLEAQMMPGSPYSNAMGPQSPMMFASHPQDEAGAPSGAPSAYPMPEAMGQEAMGAEMMGYGGEACGPQCGPECGHHGCGLFGRGYGGERCDVYGRSLTGFRHNMRGWLASKRGILRPYGEGGIATQRWFDISADGVFLARTKGSSNFAFTSDGINGPRVLTADMVDMDSLQAGLGVQANIQTGAGSNLEVLYFGLNDWDESAQVTSNSPQFFSFISDFGQLPPNGFDDSDRSRVQRIDYKSELHNGEINFRRRWSEPEGFWQGSFLGGVRYMDIDENGVFSASGENDNGIDRNGPRFFEYSVNTRNALVGFQLGGDLWYNLMPGVKVGGELKSGIFNNSTNQDTTILGNSISGEFREFARDDDDAYITQFSTQLWYRLNYSLAFKTSYQLIYIDGVSLATENFNSDPPLLFNASSTRVPTINHDAEVVYQGFTVGAEYTW
ncbi:hypothetical protein VN12_12295 [Pirellula sp. SH-Sr6A]|uniref:hypothetical protein n=1 Tax=Pirellula sp. SH-Sr6A TaxID=1632865 RepID=UPI00078B3A70|nr:hypothetical protein [Pirellula sp. SH-Sr6A]AMV32899.1 hypothetical protein VN12_12295 [Pirellula sp. SH-Sr6A]